MKIEVDTMRRKFDLRSKVIAARGSSTVHDSAPGTRNAQVRETSPHKGLHQDQRRGTNMLPLPGQSPSKLHRLP
ncbi:hypothetical protein TNCV_4463081 [Trichonephila clavipes]|nr:hypothetical protein TNCV_4463081 [Trichonephila clavipes]